MSSEWQSTTLGAICNAQGGAIQTGPFGSQLHTSDYKEHGVPVVMPTNIGDGGISEIGIARIDDSDVERLSQHKLHLGDIVFSRRGDVTKNALIQPHEVGWLCGTGCLKVRVGERRIADERFISYHLRSPGTKEWLVRHAVGATMPNLNTGILASVPIMLPPLHVQLRIGEILGSLDDCIAILRETNATLEAMAQAIFKAWFVDFEPVRAKAEGRQPERMDAATAALFPDSFEECEHGLLPKGWRVGSIYEVASVKYGAPFASKRFNAEKLGFPLIRIRDLKDEKPGVYTEEIHPKGYLAQSGDILVGMDGEFRSYLWGGGAAWLNQRVCAFKPNDGYSSAFVNFTIKPQLAIVEATEVATTVIHLGKNDIDQFKAVIPGCNISRAYSEVVNPIYAAIVNGKQKAKTLIQLRDTLLPKLISGEIRLPEAESIVRSAVNA